MKINKGMALTAVGALALGGGLLGGTYALWSDASDVAGAKVTAGLLDMEALATTVHDISPDRADSPHPIQLASWRAVPGDVIEIRQGIDVALTGDNLAAEIDLAALNAALDESLPAGTAELRLTDYVTIDAVLTAAGDTTGTALPHVDGLYRFQPATGSDKAGIPVAPAIDGTADVQSVITLAFSPDTPGQVLQNVDLSSFAAQGITLQQVRTGDGFDN